jgi:hypothetical protein
VPAEPGSTSAIRKHAGEDAIVAAGETMRMVGTGKGPRRSLVLVLHEADRPASEVVASPPTLKSCQQTSISACEGEHRRSYAGPEFCWTLCIFLQPP